MPADFYEELLRPVFRLREPTANRAVWQDLTELAVDVGAAIRRALADGSLPREAAAVLYLHYFRGITLEEIGYGLPRMSYDKARRLHRKGLEALRDTGLLEGYGKVEPDEA